MQESRTAEIGQGRVTQVFRYLQALDQLRNPAKRQVREQLWHLWLRDLPEHPTILNPALESITPRSSTDTTPIDTVEADDPSDELLTDQSQIRFGERADYVLKVRRPHLSSAPAPSQELSSWLRPGWDDPFNRAEFLSERDLPNETGEPVSVRFADIPNLVQMFESWQPLRDAWATTEKPAVEAMRVYEKLYDLHAQMARESERQELVLGDGILNWRRPDGGVHHPLLLQRLELLFDADHHEFIVREADHPVEFYSALFRSMNDVSGQVIAKFRDEVEAGAYHPLDGLETDTFLTGLSARLAAKGEFVGAQPLNGETDHPRVGRAPVIFLRTRTLGFATALESVLADLAEPVELPNSLLGVVGVEPPIAELPSSAPTSQSFRYSDGNEDEHVLLSKPANPEQLAIAQRLAKHGSVLVQGPPGTGKTHTIANLIGHLLAQGKTVLVTSHTTKALRVLREKVVPPLQPLCVSVLENGGESRQQLESAVNAIVERLASADADQLDEEARKLVAQRDGLITHLHETRDQLFHARAGEYRDIVTAGTACSPADAAKEVAEGRGSNDWIPTPVTPGAPLPLSSDEFVDLYRSNSTITVEDETDLEKSLPPINQLLSPEAFERLVQAEESLKSENLDFGQQFWKNTVDNPKPEVLQDLLERLQSAIEPLQEDQQWRLVAIGAGHAGDLEREPWESLLRLIESVRQESLQAKEALLSHGPVLAADSPLEDQERSLAEIVAHLESGGSLSTLTLLTRRSWKKLIELVRVGQTKPTRIEHFQALLSLARLRASRQNLRDRWQRQITPLGAPTSQELGDEPEIVCGQFMAPLRQCLDWHTQTWQPLEAEMIGNGLNWVAVLNQMPPVLAPGADLLRVRNAVRDQLPLLFDAQIKRLRWQYIQQTVVGLEQRLLAPYQSDPPASTLPNVALRLQMAVKNRDVTQYRAAHGRLMELDERRSQIEDRNALLQRLEVVAPAWATAIRKRHSPHEGEKAPGPVDLAWRWRQLNDELVRRDQVSIATLQQDIERILSDMRGATSELIDRRAWAAQVLRTTGPQRKALIGWVQTIRKIGKGTGKRAPQLQVDARRLMNECRSAVPVWIMPLARVVENFNPRTTRFDVVIIDEASQSDVMGMIAFYLGKQVVVVGDDEQVSPEAVGQKLDEVQHLIDEHLVGVPNANLYDGQFSVYDVAMSSFGGTICLREHFRCVPEIIRFSNYLSYNGAIKPLRDASAVHLKPHVLSYRVEAAQTESKVNEAEAMAVASLLIAATEQPEYADATFGIISMVGLPQAERIDLLLRSHLKPVEYEKRHIVCGNAAHFQGDERDVMFLSLVDAPKQGPLSMQERPQYRKRLNVAASRARDQMWVVHSLQFEIDLKPGDLRRRLLEHAQDPQALERPFEREEAHVESEFERLVLRRLLSQGYRVVPQWKVGAYRIDLVVEGEGKRLAVECDGDRYHGLDKLPEDMARQAILERLGWKFARIRGSDFFRDPDGAMQPVFARLQELNIEPLGNARESDANDQPAKSTSELTERIIRRAAKLRQEWQQPKQSEDDDAEADNSFADSYLHSPISESDARVTGVERQDVNDNSQRTYSVEAESSIAPISLPDNNGSGVSAVSPVQRSNASTPSGWRISTPTSSIRDVADLTEQEVHDAIFNNVPQTGTIEREDLLAAVQQHFGFARVAKRLRSMVNQGISAEVRAGRLQTDWAKVWRL